MRKRFFTPLRKLLIGAAAAAVAVSTIAPATAPPAEAATYKMNQGYIISNAHFYDGDAMSASEVKAHMKKLMPRPTSRSLVNHKEKTTSRKADSFCKAYSGGKVESAAAIIRKVGKACGISQKVLLVTLQKEQSLIQNPNPSNYTYERAMGYACPDTGKNYSANCNKSYFGFFNQVYYGARQMKRYGTDPGYKWIPVGKSHQRKYAPDPKCGTTSITIKNKATAALYYYTPYIANSAALNGKNNKCSSTGNLNFHRIYTNWFGSPTSAKYAVNGVIGKFYNANGRTAKFGKATTNKAVTSANGGGVFQHFQKGLITYSKKHKKTIFLPNGSVRTAYLKAGGPAKQGWPKTKLNCKLKGGGCKLTLTGKTIVQSKKTGASFVQQRHYAYWVGKGSKRFSSFGYPVKSTKTMKTGTLQRYEKSIVAINKTGKITRLHNGPILSAYIKSGWHKSAWGMPTKVWKNKKTVRFDNGVARYRGGKVTFTPNAKKSTAPAAKAQAQRQAPLAEETPVQEAPAEELPPTPEVEEQPVEETPEPPESTEAPSEDTQVTAPADPAREEH